jgi:hypothetical protein
MQPKPRCGLSGLCSNRNASELAPTEVLALATPKSTIDRGSYAPLDLLFALPQCTQKFYAPVGPL